MCLTLCLLYLKKKFELFSLVYSRLPEVETFRIWLKSKFNREKMSEVVAPFPGCLQVPTDPLE